MKRKVIEGVIYIGKIALSKKKNGEQQTKHSGSKGGSYQRTRDMEQSPAKGCEGLESKMPAQGRGGERPKGRGK